MYYKDGLTFMVRDRLGKRNALCRVKVDTDKAIWVAKLLIAGMPVTVEQMGWDKVSAISVHMQYGIFHWTARFWRSQDGLHQHESRYRGVRSGRLDEAFRIEPRAARALVRLNFPEVILDPIKQINDLRKGIIRKLGHENCLSLFW